MSISRRSSNGNTFGSSSRHISPYVNPMLLRMNFAEKPAKEKKEKKKRVFAVPFAVVQRVRILRETDGLQHEEIKTKIKEEFDIDLTLVCIGQWCRYINRVFA